MKWVYVLLVLILVSSVFAYTGCPGSSPIKVTARADDEYWLSFVNRDNMQYNVPFAQATQGSLHYGREGTRDFITQEVSGFDALLAGPNPEDAFNINRKNTFLVTGDGLVGSSHVLEYESIDVANKVIVFEDLASGPKMVNFMPAPDKDPSLVLGQFNLVVGGSTFTGFISSTPSNSLSIDLDGNGALNGDTAPVIVRGGGVLDIGSSDGSAAGSILVSLTTPGRNFRDSKGDESLGFTVSSRNGQVSIGGVQYYRNGILRTSKSIPSFDLYKDSHTNHWYGATDYGVLIQYIRSSTVPEEITLDYPGLGLCTPQFPKSEVKEEVVVKVPPKATPPKLQVVEKPVVKEVHKEEPEAPMEEESCAGCLTDDGGCIAIGARDGDSFCDPRLKMLAQNQDKEPCQNGYECLSNQCQGGVCVNPVQETPPQKSFFQKAWGWLVSIF
ncbi:MAG: hypothetical protein AABX70_04630 [Nanoarchaeota archaeon]